MLSTRRALRTAIQICCQSSLLLACTGSLPPLRNRIEVGRDRYLVFVGGGGPAGGDLYAVPASGGQPFPITFTNVGEMRPALSPDGAALAFLRGGSLRDSIPSSVWLMNLLNGAERELTLPQGAGVPRALGWARDGRSLVVDAEGGLYRVGVPPAPAAARMVPRPQRAQAESTLAVLLGTPAFARVVPCSAPGDLCVAGDTGTPALLARSATDAVRWGSDSVAYLTRGLLEIRPLGPGRARRFDWSSVPRQPRQLTTFMEPSSPPASPR